jgi:hypothetical protein
LLRHFQQYISYPEKNQKHTSYITNIFIKQLESNTSLHFREWKLSNIGGDEFYLPGYMQNTERAIQKWYAGADPGGATGAVRPLRLEKYDFFGAKS